MRDLGQIVYAEAFALQQDFVERRKRGEIPDQLLIVEHPHVVTMGRNGHDENLLAPPEVLAPVLAVVRGQQLALELARLLGRDPDSPPGLRKVTIT